MKCQTNCTNCNHLTKITHLVKMRRGKSGEEKEIGGGKRERDRGREEEEHTTASVVATSLWSLRSAFVPTTAQRAVGETRCACSSVPCSRSNVSCVMGRGSSS